MGIALASTLFAMVITTFGCLAVSDDIDLVKITAWGIAYNRNYNNVTEELVSGDTIYFGPVVCQTR